MKKVSQKFNKHYWAFTLIGGVIFLNVSQAQFTVISGVTDRVSNLAMKNARFKKNCVMTIDGKKLYEKSLGSVYEFQMDIGVMLKAFILLTSLQIMVKAFQRSLLRINFFR